MSWRTRASLIFFAALIVGLAGTQGCTRRGSNIPAAPTPTPQTVFFVDPSKGSDSSGNGTQSKPYRTITKALTVVKKDANTGLSVALGPGYYSSSSGEVFPIVVPTGVTITGTYTGRPKSGVSYVSGLGEDKALESAVGAHAGTYYTTMEVPGGVTGVSINTIYVGARAIKLASGKHYAAFDVLGALNASHATFGASLAPNYVEGGIILPSGSLVCSACVTSGTRYGIEAFTVASASSPPSINLTGQISQSLISGRYASILTDGTATITASNQTFQSTNFAYADTVTAPTSSPTLSPRSASPTASPTTAPTGTGAPAVSIDFGSESGSTGGNQFNYSRTQVELMVTQANQQISALGNTWKPGQQNADGSGLYRRPMIFHLGDKGENVTITGSGSTVIVGPIPQPTPTPPSPSPSPTASAT